MPELIVELDNFGVTVVKDSKYRVLIDTGSTRSMVSLEYLSRVHAQYKKGYIYVQTYVGKKRELYIKDNVAVSLQSNTVPIILHEPILLSALGKHEMLPYDIVVCAGDIKKSGLNLVF